MALIHTIEINETKAHRSGVVKATRKSATRRYGACLVATATEGTITKHREILKRYEAKAREAEAALKDAEAAHCMTVAAARAQFKSEDEREGGSWFARLFAERDLVRDAAAKRAGVNPDDWRWRFDQRDAIERQAVANLAARGEPDPYRKGGPHDVISAAQAAKSAARTVTGFRMPALGDEVVISWHRDAGLASKSAGSRTAGYYTERGWRVSVRTDIEIRETKPRARKVAK